jgi:gas vesicle protein
MSKGKFALGAIIGAGAGLVAGILTAPKSGKETRADIKAKASDVKAKATNRANEAKAKASDVKADVTAKATELKERTERAVEGAKKGFNTPSKK